MRTAIFRCDASNIIGSGHVMRCLTVAGYLKDMGWECAFAVAPGTEETVPALAASPHRITGADGPPQGGKTFDVAFFDHYGLSAADETTYRTLARRIVVFDDLADRAHDCDLLLDQTFGRNAVEYRALVPAGATILAGTDYALIRPEFALAREHSLKRRAQAGGKLERVLVSLGGTDPHNTTAIVLDGLADCGLAVDVVMGAAALNYDAIAMKAESLRQSGMAITLHRDSRNMAALMAAADIAIGAGGTTSWERCCLGLPTILIETADNQALIAKKLDDTGAVRNLGRFEHISAKSISVLIRKLMESPSSVQDVSSRAARVCDGKGTDRLYNSLVCLDISLRKATIKDADEILEWRNHEDIRNNSTNPGLIARDAHIQWFKSVLADANRDLLIFSDGPKNLGVLRLDYTGRTATISIYLNPAMIGRGTGWILLKKAEDWILHQRAGITHIHAKVLPHNARSRKSFLKAGYVDHGECLVRELE